jgi:hypothetical protein
VTFVVVLPLLLQVIVPLALIAWVAWGDARSWFAWLAGVVATAAWLSAIALAGIWLAIPALVLPVLVALFVPATMWSCRRTLRDRSLAFEPRGRRAVAAALARGAFALSAAFVLGRLASERRAPPYTIDLRFPLDGGNYLIVNGGAGQLSNAHLATLADHERYRPWRGQSHGVDLVRVNAARLRSHAPLSSEPAAYLIFGDTVRAPCSGAVVQAGDGNADQRPPHPDREHMMGNHVILACGDAWVLLAHLRNGSVLVERGQTIATGEALGVVGNSGNSTEPHLHVHAQRPGTAAAPVGGAPLHVRFDGRFLARNALVRRGSPALPGPSVRADVPTRPPTPRP